jgi:hypothetical protein
MKMRTRNFKTGEITETEIGYDLDILLNERPEFGVTKEEKDFIVEEAKDFPHIVVEVTKMKENYYHIALWDKEFYEDELQEIREEK